MKSLPCLAAVRAAFLLSSSLLVLPTIDARADWPSFRGPHGDGQAPHTTGLPLNWSEQENVRWKTPIPDKGWCTPVALEGKIWLTSASADGKDYSAYCVDAASGKLLHSVALFHSDAPEPLGNAVNCYAAPSSAIEPGRVYVHFGSYGTACLDNASGRVLWKRNDLPCRHYRGPSSSVVLFENLVILTMDGADLQYHVALDKKTGKTVWKTDRSVEWNDANSKSKYAKDGDLRKAHSTPLIVTVDGSPLMLSAGAKAAYGYDPRTGRELWRVQYSSWSAAPMPLYRKGLAYFVTGHGKTELIAVRLGGKGDITETNIAWRIDSMVPKTASPVIVDDLLYMISDDGLVTCVEAETGKQVWRQRLPDKYAASPIHAEGRLYFCNQKGQTTVIKPGRSCEILATNSLESGFMASPAVEGNDLILRTRTHLYRIGAAKP